MLTSKLESLKMQKIKKNHNFFFFYSKLSDIANFSFNLGKQIPNSKVVRKILRSFPKKFRAKVIIIEESKDIDSMRVGELVGYIQNFLILKVLKSPPLRPLRMKKKKLKILMI